MNTRLALRPLAGIILLLGLLLLALRGLLALGITDIITPPPDSPAQGLLVALLAHREEGARGLLSRAEAERVPLAQLHALASALEQAPHGGLLHAQVVDVQENGEMAVARLALLCRDQSEQTLDLELVREDWVWRVKSIDPLWALVNR